MKLKKRNTFALLSFIISILTFIGFLALLFVTIINFKGNVSGEAQAFTIIFIYFIAPIDFFLFIISSLLSLLSLIFSIIGITQIRKKKEKGIVLSIIALSISTLYILFGLWLFLSIF